MNVNDVITQALTLSEDKKLLAFSHYWETCASLLTQKIKLQEEAFALQQELIQLETKVERIEVEMQVLIAQDKRLSNETQRKATLNSFRFGNEEWVQLTTEEIPARKAKLDHTKIEIDALRKVYELCYIALNSNQE